MGSEDQMSPTVRGGFERARRLTSAQRTQIARQAAYSRWMNEGKEPPILAEYGAPDRPLRIGSIEIPCYVLADTRRVLSQRGLMNGIGLSTGGGSSGERRVATLMVSLAKKGLEIKDLIARSTSPIRFIPPHGGNPADGYEATILPDICAVIIEAGRRGLLQKQQAHLAQRCAILQHGFATVGIIALVDEATGFQDFRARDALAKILEKFVQKELRPWVKTFAPDFYKEIFRLYGWNYADNAGKPSVLGHLTNNLVYKRLAPGVKDELHRLTPRDQKGHLKNKLFQRLTQNIGHPKLREHLAGVTMLLKYSRDWKQFMERLDREFPSWEKGTKLPLPFPAELSDQDG